MHKTLRAIGASILLVTLSSLAAAAPAMTLMLAAQGRGLVSCPMIGFDQAGVAAEFGLLSTDVPVMLVTLGHAVAGNWPQKPRRDIGKVFSFA